MMSSHECVNQIETILASGDPVAKEQVAELVWAYASACRRLNDKAQKCLDLLRQGRRAEALRLALEPPYLGEELLLLDFPLRSAWLDLAEGAGLPIGQSLDANALGNIVQEVITEGSTLERLLKTFRRMSLGQAPLADRLRLLRQIRQADPNHDHWTDDMRAFEKARLAELVKAAEDADVRDDLATLEVVLAEIRSGEWMASHARLANAVDKIALPHRQRYAYARYNELARDLHEAHAGMDEARCRALMAEWQGVQEQTGVEPAASMKEEVAPIEAWLAERNAVVLEEATFQEACDALEQALDENKDRLALEKLAATVFRFERGMPEVLAARFNTRIEEINRKARRRFALTLTGVVGGLILLAAAVTAVIWFQGRRMEHARWQIGIEGALEKGDVAGAGKLLDAAREKAPEVYASPEIQSLQHKHDELKNTEEARCAEWASLQKKVDDAGPEHPEPAALERLGQLARTPEDKHFVEDWREKYQTAEDGRKRKRNEDFHKQLEELQRLYAAFRQAEQAQRDDLEALAGPLLATARRLAGAAAVDKELVDQAAAIEKSVIQSLKVFQETAGKRQAAQGALSRLPALADRPDEYAAALEAFAKDNANHPMAAHFIKATAMADHWRSTVAWLRLVEGWKGRILLQDSQTASERRSQLEAYLKNHAGSPFETVAKEHLVYLEVAQGAMVDGRLVGIQKVKDVLDLPVFTPSLQTLRTAEGNFYFLPKGLHEQRANDKVVGYSLDYLTATSMTTAHVSVAKDQVLAGPVPAPQTAFAETAIERLTQFKGAGWETFYLRLATLAQEQKGMDPVLTGQVLQLLLGFAGSSTPYTGSQLKQFADQIGAQNLDFVPWLNPQSGTAEQARLRVTAILKGMGSFQAMADDLEKRLKALEGMIIAYRPVGILMGDPERVFQPAQSVADATAYVVQVRPGGAPEFVLIGEIKGGKLVGDAALTRSSPPGTPVFVRLR